MKDAIGQTIVVGSTVAYSRVRSGTVSINKRTVHSLQEGVTSGWVKLYDPNTGKPSSSKASSYNMVVVPE